MSNWNGKAGKGAMRTLRTAKRQEAEARQASFAADVSRARAEHPDFTEEEVRKFVAAERRAAREQ
jgi:hypothetical protein